MAEIIAPGPSPDAERAYREGVARTPIYQAPPALPDNPKPRPEDPATLERVAEVERLRESARQRMAAEEARFTTARLTAKPTVDFARPGKRNVSVPGIDLPLLDDPGRLRASAEARVLDDAFVKKMAAFEAAAFDKATGQVADLMAKLVADLPEAKTVRKLAADLKRAQEVQAAADRERAGHAAKVEAALDQGQNPAVHDLAHRLASRKVAAAQGTVANLEGQLNAARAVYKVVFLNAYTAEVNSLIAQNGRDRDKVEEKLAVDLARQAVALEVAEAVGDKLHKAMAVFDDKRWGGSYDPNTTPRAEAIKNGWITPGMPVPDPVQ
jgi:hypothetical protein